MRNISKYKWWLDGGGVSQLLTNLVSYWKLDESSGSAIDSVGTNNGTPSNVTYSATGKIGTAYTFNGTTSFINIDNTVNDLASTTVGTWTAWVNPVDATPSASGIIISFSDTNAVEFNQVLINATTGILTFQTRKAGTNQFILNTDAAPFSDGVFTHIAVVQDGVSPVIYVNGVAVAQTFTVTTNKGSWFSDLTGIDNGRIGDRNFNNGGESVFFNGTIDEVAIWDRVLTNDEILELYNSGAGKTYPF